MSAGFDSRVVAALADERRQSFVREATRGIDERRRRAWAELPDADALRQQAAAIKDHTLERLDEYLERFIAELESAGARVHLASTGQEATRQIATIAASSGCRCAVKGKSMASEEIELNAALEASGVEVVETDLGEFVVQIEDDRPSHIVLPIIHQDISTVARAIERHVGVECGEDEQALTRAAREHLRPVFRRADLGISGVNLGVAETGTLVLVTNEGNGRMTTSVPRVHVALMGIEKLVPRLVDTAVFLKLLARSATGQTLTSYTSFITGPRRDDDPDGPEELHVVILDRGRSDILGSRYREVLRCIRCGSCLNACPVYGAIGGHAYGSVYPGPIGSVVTPLLEGLEQHADLPVASSLCRACVDACPVQIDIPHLLVELRGEAARRGMPGRGKRLAIKLALRVARSPRLYSWAWRGARLALRPFARGGWLRRGPGPARAWTGAGRDLKLPARRSFRDLWRKGIR